MKTLKQIEEALAPLYEQKEILEKKIIRLCSQRDKLRDQEASEFIKTIPSNPKKISKEQWEWILKRGFDTESIVRYRFTNKLLESLGFSSFGFWQESHQAVLTVSHYGLNPIKLKEAFLIVKPHLKVVKIKDFTTETGIRFEVSGLEEDTRSVLYVHKKGDVALYTCRHCEAQKFKSFNDFVDWYTQKVIGICVC